MKIEDYLASLPQSIISGQDVQLPDNAFREIFRFVQLNKDDVFYHLGCGNGKGMAIALEEFGVKKAVGIDNDKEKISFAKKLLEEKKISNGIVECQDILESDISDATVILFWFSDQNIIEKMMPKFSNLKEGCRIITIWGPLPGTIPNDRFLTILQSLVIWINAKNLGVACGHEIPIPIKNYISLLRTYFNIDVEYLLNED
ncbi:MAG: methyltransferase domain-containing protein [Thaumarchaeota archaeon]|nr:methyltransferase domain-containing protein [Nitrososphaerota archaeon]